MVRKVVETHPNVQAVGTTLREVVSGLVNNWSAIMYYDGVFHASRKFSNLEIEDRVGGGDGFCSGFVSQKTTALMRTSGRIHRLVGWGMILPLRLLPPLLDPQLSNALRWPPFTITLVAARPFR